MNTMHIESSVADGFNKCNLSSKVTVTKTDKDNDNSAITTIIIMIIITVTIANILRES